MAVVRVSLDDLAATVGADIERIKPRVLAAVQDTVQVHGPRLFAAAVATAQPRPPVDRGTYRRNTHIEDLPDGAVMYNRTPYAGVIEEGRRPGRRMPPVRLLAEWVRRKGISKDPAEAKQIAFAIARKMKAQGWPFAPNQPMRIMGKVAERLDPLIQEEIDKAMRELF